MSRRDIPSATLVHDLAIRGAEALVADHRRQEAAIERLVRRTTAHEPGFDRDILIEIDRHAWGRE